jgi:hypothetical protein
MVMHTDQVRCMSATIAVAPKSVWTDPEIEGLDVSEDEWRLDVERYQELLVETTDISPADGLSASDCYRIGNRLQALVEEHKRQDEGESGLVEAHPDVGSLEEFLCLARVFRACHDCHDAGETCVTTREREESCGPSRELQDGCD